MATVKKNLTCLLTVEEMKTLGVELADVSQKKRRLEDDKKQAMSQYKAEIDAADAEINAISQKISSGREIRMVECTVRYHTPQDGMKTIERNDTGEIVEVVKMTDSELEDLFINGLGANRDEKYFTFRNRKRVPLVPLAAFREAQAQCEFKRLFSGTENQMAEYNLVSIHGAEENMFVVDCEAVFDLYVSIHDAGRADEENIVQDCEIARSQVIETRLLETSDNE